MKKSEGNERTKGRKVIPFVSFCLAVGTYAVRLRSSGFVVFLRMNLLEALLSPCFWAAL